MATQKLYRCLQCKAEFSADRPHCAACGIDPQAEPRDADFIVELVIHHFDPPSKREGRGLGHAACNPALKCGRPKMSFTGEPVAVNCPACKATKAFADAGGESAGAVRLAVGPLDTKGD